MLPGENFSRITDRLKTHHILGYSAGLFADGIVTDDLNKVTNP